MNSKNSKTAYPHRLLHNLSDNINLKRGEVMCCFIKSQLILYMEKYFKNHTKTVN